MNALEIQTLACGAYGWFQQALIRLCVCAAVALFAVLVLRTQPIRDAASRIASLWRGAAYWMRLVAMSLVFGFVLYAVTKTNSPPLGMMMPPLPQSVVQQITDQKIAQGWRLVAETDCYVDVIVVFIVLPITNSKAFALRVVRLYKYLREQKDTSSLLAVRLF